MSEKSTMIEQNDMECDLLGITGNANYTNPKGCGKNVFGGSSKAKCGDEVNGKILICPDCEEEAKE